MVEPTADNASINNTFDINIYLDDVDDLYGASVDFIFDSSIVRALNNGDTPSLLEKSNFLAPYFEFKKIDQADSKGAYSFVKCLTGKEPGVDINTKTLLCSVPLKAVGKGNIKVKAANYNDKITCLDLSENTLLIHLANSSTLPIYYSSPQSLNVTVISNSSTSTDRDSSRGSGKTSIVPRSETITSKGGQIVHENVTLEIPPAVFKEDEQLKISKIIDTAQLPIAKKHKLVSEVVEIARDNNGNFTKPVTITILFNRSKVDLDAYILSICWLDEEKEEWVELDNVKIDLIHNKVSGEVTHFTKFAIIAKPIEAITPAPVEIIDLTDLQGHWAKESIDILLKLEILTGYPDSTFKPDNSISRAEFTKILVKAFNLGSAEREKQFKDTISHWANEYILTAAGQGIVNGYNQEYFYPDDCITREQMAAMITRAANLQKSDHNIKFEDSNQISNWAKDAVKQAAGSGIICGYPDNTFKPQNNLTRAEAAVVIEKVLK